MRVIECAEADASRWDAFVAAHADSTFFHQFGWRAVLHEGLGHTPYYLLAEDDDGTVRAVLPLVFMRSLLFGRALSSLAFATMAGPLAQDEAARAAVEDAAHGIAERLAVDALEYRLLRPGNRGRVVKTLYDVFIKDIAPDAEANMAAIRSKQRNVIRKGIKNGLVARRDSLDEFYPVYAESVRNLGTPVFPRRLFASIAHTFPQQVEFVSACHEGRAVSSAMNFYYRDTVCPYYWGGVYAARRLNGNDFLAWSILCRAAERGCTRFDFGRSKQGTGAYEWKRNLGFEPAPLYYEYELVRAREMPNVNPLNPKYRLLVAVWKKLPLPVAGWLGPLLSRSLG